MSKYLTLGLSLKQVVKATTEIPAKAIFCAGELGTLRVGSCADITICKLVRSETIYTDNLGNILIGKVLLKPQMTIINGQIVYRQIDF